MKRCTACSRASRKLQRALVLDGPGAVRRGLVCAQCASTGWLFVFGGERENKAHSAAVRSVAAKALGALTLEERRVALSLAGKS